MRSAKKELGIAVGSKTWHAINANVHKYKHILKSSSGARPDCQRLLDLLYEARVELMHAFAATKHFLLGYRKSDNLSSSLMTYVPLHWKKTPKTQNFLVNNFKVYFYDPPNPHNVGLIYHVILPAFPGVAVILCNLSKAQRRTDLS